jgi:cell division protein FtsI/penicillin-binding protein 2
MFFVLLAVYVALAGRLVYIHLEKGESLKVRADRQQQAYLPLLSVRGTIYDRRGRILAGTKIVPSLFGDPGMIDDPLGTADVAGALVGSSAAPILHKLEQASEKSRFVWLERDISEDAAESLLKLRRKSKLLEGLGIITEPKRIYTTGTVAGHVLGAVGVDDDEGGIKGIEGVELYYDKLLKGKDGCERYVRDASGRKVWLLKDKCKTPVNGNHIILSIDRVVQQFTQRILAEACTHYEAEAGMAVVMDPKTGDVLAMAVWPEVDPNNFGNSPAEVRRNRVITDPFEPGSIFKPFIAARALADGVVRADESIFCHGGAYQSGRRTLRDAHKFGYLTFPEIISKSGNIGMGILGERMGNERLHAAVKAFGFGQKTGVDLKGEGGGIVLPLKRWTEYSTLSIPMGQEIACTSLQLVTALAGLANDGKVLRPRFFRAAIDERGQVVKERTEPEVVSQAVSPEVARFMVQKAMRMTVTDGTGKKADVPGYQVFGKTGTAQIARSKGRGYEPDAYVGSFMGGAPANDPQVVVGVNIRKPNRKIGYYGGTVAAPAAKEILAAYFEYMQIPPFEKLEGEGKISYSSSEGQEAE